MRGARFRRPRAKSREAIAASGSALPPSPHASRARTSRHPQPPVSSGSPLLGVPVAVLELPPDAPPAAVVVDEDADDVASPPVATPPAPARPPEPALSPPAPAVLVPPAPPDA